KQVMLFNSCVNPVADVCWLCDCIRFDTLPITPRVRQPMVRENGNLQPSGWNDALSRCATLLDQNAGVLASAGLSNEAFWVLQRLSERVPAALWPAPGGAWPVQGAI